MSSLREALASALEASESGTLETVDTAPSVDTAPVETVETVPHETAEAKEARVRDEAGRFATKPEAKEEPAAPVARKPPSSWKKDYWDHYTKLDPRLQDYIDQRESEAASGVSTYKKQYDEVAPFHQALQPFMPSLQQRGLRADKWLQDLGHVDRILSTGTPQEKAQLLHRMAAQNGVQLDPQNQQPVDPLWQTVSGLQNEIQAFKSAQAQQEQAALQVQIKEFAASHPHFEAVRTEMGRLLHSQLADSMQSAYDKAIRLNDDTWQEHQAQQAKEAAAKRQAEIDQKKAAASSPRSASPTGALSAGNGKKSLRETLSDAMDTQISGRV